MLSFSLSLVRFCDIQSIPNLQLEVGTSSTAYQPYQNATYTIDLGATELCKIGTYQDKIYKSGGDWYVHKETGKVIIDGAYGGYNSTYNWYYCTPAQYGGPAANSNAVTISNLFTYVTFTTFRTDTSLVGMTVESGGFRLRNTAFSSASDYQTWLSNNNANMYYQLATPTDTKITDATLISELEAVLNASTYGGETDIEITATGTNLPAPLSLTAVNANAKGIVYKLRA